MASLTYDGHSFLVDGRRIWIVSGSIAPSRVPRAAWADRIHAAKQAGLNTIDVTICWARHEARPGQFDFKEQNDIRHFVELIGQAGLYCILRPGPYIGHGFDMGGIPPWLPSNPNVKLRTANQPFLEACSRYITAVVHQVRDLQVSSPPPARRAAVSHAQHTPGPIILVQSENAWVCGHDTLATGYLGELDRYYREAGISVPIVNSNELWTSVEGEIDTWSGHEQMLAHLRQFAAIRPTSPRLVIDFRIGKPGYWGHKPETPVRPQTIARRLAEILAAGGQFNIAPFHGGAHGGFWAGRDPVAPDAFLATSNDQGAPLNELGLPGACYEQVRAISTFASRFARVLSHIEPTRSHASVAPGSRLGGAGAAPAVSVVHAGGAQGSVAFVFGDETGAGPIPAIPLLLPDGSTLPVELGDQPVVWCLLDTRLWGRANLDYCNLSALAVVGKVFVCFGAAGSRAMLSINGSPLEAPVPSGEAPTVLEHEGVTIVIAGRHQLGYIHTDDQAVYIGVAGLDRAGRPIPHGTHKTYIRLTAEGASTTIRTSHGAPTARRHARPGLSEWSSASAGEHLDGTSERYASINGPADLTSLGSPYGYGWYRVEFSSSSARRVHIVFPKAAHRLHVAFDGEHAGVVGSGPGATFELARSLKRGDHTLVALAENLGRVSAGPDLGESVGLYGHAWAVKPLRPARPTIVPSDPIDLLAFRAPLWRINQDDVSDTSRLTWVFQHRRKTPVIVHIADFTADSRGEYANTAPSAGAVIILNNKPIQFLQTGGLAPLFLEPEALARGKNTLQIAMVGSTEAVSAELTKAVTLYEGIDNLTDGAEWAFAKWEPPPPDAFHLAPRREHAKGTPAWWRASFTPDDDPAPLLFDGAGLSKGQIYVNGRHLCRYFVATASGKSVPPQSRYAIPRSLLTPGEANEIMLFDEHGFSPSKARLVTDAVNHGEG